MSRTLTAVGATGLTALVLLGLLPATSASATSFTTAPYLTSVGGWKVEYNSYGGSDPSDPVHEVGSVAFRDTTPTFRFATSPSQSGGLLSARNANGELLCTSKVTKSGVTECTPSKPLPFGVSDVKGSVLLADGTTTSDKSLQTGLITLIPDPTIRLDSYDEEGHVASVSGWAQPGTAVQVSGGEDQHAVTLSESGRWTSTVKADRGSWLVVTSDENHTGSSGRIQLDPPSSVPLPTVTTEKKDGAFLITVHHTLDTTAVLRDLDGKYVAAGSGPTVDGETVTQLRVADPGHEVRYSVVADRGDIQSPAVPVVLNPGVGSDTPDKPVASVASHTPTRAVLAVTGTKGAIVRVADENGRVVAVRALGASGVAQVAVTLPAAKADEPVSLEVTQTADGATSPSARVTF